MKTLAIIPARGGSTRLPRKNVKEFHGKPLIAWTILPALASTRITKVVVTSEDDEILTLAKKYGAEAPFVRPSNLSTGSGMSMEVLTQALEWYKENENFEPDAVVLLVPTNPLRLPQHLDEMIDIFEKKNVDSVVAVCEATANNNPHWILTETEEGVRMFTGESLKNFSIDSQTLPKCYSRNDIGYVLKPSNLYEDPPNLYGDNIELYGMNELFYGDVNTPEDWHIAYDKFKRLHKLKK